MEFLFFGLGRSPCAGAEIRNAKSSPLYAFLVKEAGLGEAWPILRVLGNHIYIYVYLDLYRYPKSYC